MTVVTHQREDYLDMVKAISIFLMVFCHTGYSSQFNVWVYAFHMPIFFFISGMFVDEKKSEIKYFINKRFKQILVPYLLFALIYCFGQKGMVDWMYIFYGSRNALSFVKSFTPLWFLPCIFVANILFYIILNLYHTFRLRLLACIICSVIGFFISYRTPPDSIGFPLSLNVALVCQILMLVGKYLKERNALINTNLFSGGSILLVCSFLAYLNLPFSLDPNCNHIEMSIGSFGNPLLFIVNSLGISIGFCSLSIFFTQRISKSIISKLSFYGKYSLTILCAHYVALHIFSPLHKLISNAVISSLIITLLVFAISFPLVLMLERLCPNLIGK